MRALTLALLLASAHAAEPARHLGLIYFGGTGGVSCPPRWSQALNALEDAPDVDKLAPAIQGPLAYRHGDRLLFREGGLTVAAFKAFLSRPPFKRHVRAADWVTVEGQLERLFEFPPEPETPALDLLMAKNEGLHRLPRLWVQYENKDGAMMDALETPEEASPLEADPLAWEVSFITESYVRFKGGARRRVFALGDPVNEGARRLSHVRALRARMEAERPGAPILVLSGGGDVEHFSFMDTAAPDRQRSNTWWALQEMGVDVMAPGAAEVAFGLDALQREAQGHGVRIVGANTARAPFTGAALLERGGLKILIIGLLDPDMPTAERLRGFGDRPLTELGAAVTQEIEAATARLGRRPDVIIGLGRLPAGRHAELRGLGLDALLVDFDGAPLTESRGVSHRALRRGLAPPPLALTPTGSTRVGSAWIELEATTLRPVAAESAAYPVIGEDPPPDPALFRRLQAVRQAAYETAQIPLLPDLLPIIRAGEPQVKSERPKGGVLKVFTQALAPREEAAPQGVSAEAWQRLLVNLLRRQTGSELALLPKRPLAWRISGPVSRLEAAANLDIPDDVVLIYLKPAQIKALIGHPIFGELRVSGLELTSADPKILGRPMDERAWYRVALPRGVAELPAFQGIFKPLVIPIYDLFRVEGARIEEDSGGARRKLRDVLLAGLGEPDIKAALPQLLAVKPPKEGRWVIDLRDLSLETHNYNTYGPRAAYANVRETRVTGLESVSVAGRGDVSVRREGAGVDWINRLTGEFAETRYEEAPDQETADAFKASTELQINALTLLGSVPYANLGYITELTPTEDNPRKRQVESTTGLAWRGEFLREIKLGGIVTYDLAAEDQAPELGLLAQLDFKRPLGASSMFIEGDGRYFFPDVTRDTDEELGVILKLRAGLDVPLIGGFGVGLFVDLFAYRGQVPEAHDPGASALTGVRLKYDRVFKPGHE